ncbi:Interferon regulatory factor 3 [Bagarius yarrelli]|uniref:Interferon regulatory factor 3 n=1 Tax=Bagarius yarrelli TaxID=175774 RepID=A0A556TRJ7_BAGYA|nr:Interferon regulatory factor 3 [Bagarius yarrelli]
MISVDTFRIPWKHNSRKDCGDEDNKIFREWAVVSGKINEHPNDKAKWKTNFRCALNSLRQFKMIQDNSKDENPYKIYQILRPENSLHSARNNQYEEMEKCNIGLAINKLSKTQQIKQTTVSRKGQLCSSTAFRITPPQPYILPSINELEISIHYRRTKMLKRQVLGPSIQLHAQCDQSELEGIYGYRQDKCIVFVSTSNPAEIQKPEPRKLRQNQSELLFSFDKYKKDLIDFKENRRGSPEYTIYLCFGERFPDEKPLERKLIVVKVVPLVCRELHRAAQLEGASSLQNDNISLQFSHNSLYELIEATFSPPPAV